MDEPELKENLHHYLQGAREAILWKLEGLSEYDVRRPLTPTGTNLLGIVKHLASVELEYFGPVFDRPHGIDLPGMAKEAEANADMWAAPGEGRDEIVGLYRRASEHSDATIAALSLGSPGLVPWWGEDGRTTLGHVLIHMTAETQRHAGHADVVRELIDGAAGLTQGNGNLPEGGPEWWAEYRERLEMTARMAGTH